MKKGSKKYKLQSGGHVPNADFIEVNKDINDNLQTETELAKNFFRSYISSPKYRERLVGMGYDKPDDAINLRKAFVDITKSEKKIGDIGSHYSLDDNKVYIDPLTGYMGDPNEAFNNWRSALAHEFSHVAGALNPHPKIPFPVGLSAREVSEIEKRNKLGKVKMAPAHEVNQIIHDRSADESKADVDSLRYMLYKDGIYDAGTQDFNQDVLNKAKEKYKSGEIKRLFKNFSDKDIIWMMNSIAYNNQKNDIPMAKNGAKIKKSKYQLGGNYNWDMPTTDNLPSVLKYKDNNKAVDIYGNTSYVQNNEGTPTANNPDIMPLGQKPNFMDKLMSFPNRTEDDPNYAMLRSAMVATTGVANWINNNKQRDREEEQYLRMVEPRYYENMERYGLNSNPIYTKFGGKTSKYQMGGEVSAMVSSQAAAGNPVTEESPNPFDQYYSANATLAYYKDILNNKLKAKNPQGFQDYFKGLVDLRRQGKTQDAFDYVQSTPYNDFLTPDEVKTILGDADYQRYLNSLKSVNAYNVQQGQQPLWGNEEGENDVTKLNYGRRFASLQVTPRFALTNTGRGTTYNRNYAYNPKTQQVDIAEEGDLSIRPKEFRPVPTLKFKNGGLYQSGGYIPSTYGLDEDQAGMANVEAERGEAFMDYMGNVGQVALDAATHEQGGVMLPNVHKVLENTSNMRNDKSSRYLQLQPDQVKALTGIDTTKPMSHAEAMRKANEQYEDQRNNIVKKVELASKDRLDLDKYGENAVKLNLEQMKSIPTEQQLFDRLFTHQEVVKEMNDISDSGNAKNGKLIYKNGGLSREADYGSKKKPYPSVKSGDFAGGDRSYPIPTKADAIDALRLAGLHGRSDVKSKVYAKYPDLKKAQLGGYTGNKSGLRTPAGNSDAFPTTAQYNFQNYLDNITGQGFKYEGITNPKEFQLALYDYALKNNPEDIRRMWQEGMHQAGMNQAKQLGFVDAKGNFKKGVLDDPNNLAKLRDIYADGILGVRTLALNKKPPRIWQDEDVPQPEQQTPPAQDLDTTITPPNIRRQPGSQFYEPLRWFDVASPVNAYIAALRREPELYNPMEFNQLRYKLQDPTATLQANQADFNAAVQTVQNTNPGNAGVQMANIANLAAQKYALNNQVLGQYENQNAQIKNQEILYNTQVRDKQSAADQQARAVYNNDVLTAKAKQQEQKLTAMDALYKTIAENRALNRNGNLMMKFSRAFDQYGEYNGYTPQFQVNPTLGVPQATSNAKGYAGAAGGIQGLVPGKSYYNRKTGKTLYFDGSSLKER